MKELIPKYKESIKLLSSRIEELNKIRSFLISHTLNPDKDPKIITLNVRINPLKEMLNDLKKVTQEVKNYYERGWWRSEKYTLNQRKSRKYIYVEPIYDQAIDEQERPVKHEENARRCNKHYTYRKTTPGSRHVLYRRKKNP